MDIKQLRELEAKATAGPWISAIYTPQTASEDGRGPYALEVSGSGPRFMPVGRSRMMHGEDMKFICYLRNAAPYLFAVVEAADRYIEATDKYEATSDAVGRYNATEATLRTALSDFRNAK